MSYTAPSQTLSKYKQTLQTCLIVLAVAVVAGAMWVIGASVLENMRFAQGTHQLLRLIGSAQDMVARDKNFATVLNEDLLYDMMRVGLVTEYSNTRPVSMTNPWDGSIHSISPATSLMRIETDVPPHVCRRMALFFVKNGKDLGLRVVEVRGSDPAWQRFYAPADGINFSNTRAIEDACDRASRVTLAFVLAVR